jgi:putative aminopeptidase FrvX
MLRKNGSLFEEVIEKSKEKMSEKFFENLKKLSGTDSFSGEEKFFRDYCLVEKLKEYQRESRVDGKGNLWSPSSAPEGCILLCSHMDKIGMAKEAVVKGDKIIGRLDDSLGMSIILEILERGFRPSILFTVEEESGCYGSEFAAGQIDSGKEECPRLAVVIDVSARERPGCGTISYISSGREKFSEEDIKKIKKVLEAGRQRAVFLPGYTNDSANLAFRHIPVTTMQVHVDNMHSERETAQISDVEEVKKAVEVLIKNYNKF